MWMRKRDIQKTVTSRLYQLLEGEAATVGRRREGAARVAPRTRHFTPGKSFSHVPPARSEQLSDHTKAE